MKVTICDPCKTFDNVTTETLKYLKVKGHPHLRIDICDKHGAEVKKLNMIDYAKYAYKCHGINLDDKSDEEIKKFAFA